MNSNQIINVLSCMTILICATQLSAEKLYLNQNLKNQLINDDSSLKYDSGESNFSNEECFDICLKFGNLARNICSCDGLQKTEEISTKTKRQYPINCQVLCFIGQGGKACNCNYAPFVGRK